MMNFKQLFSQALQAGISDVQVFLSGSKEMNIESYEGKLDRYEISDVSGLSIKGIYHGKLANYYTENLNQPIAEIISNLIENAKVIDSTDEPIIYAGDKEYAKADQLYNPKLDQVDVSDKIEKVKTLDNTLKNKDPRVMTVQALYAEGSRSVTLENTKGLKLSSKANAADLFAEVIVKNDVDQRNQFDLIHSSDPADLEIEPFATNLVQNTLRSLGAKPIATGEYAIVFNPTAFSLLVSAFQGIFHADNVQKNLSLLKGKLGEKIGSDQISIVDDPLLRHSMRSRPFDDEGVATIYKELVKNGMLNTYLYNLVSAKKDNVSSTGNGFGGSTSALNLVVKAGNRTPEQLMRDVDNGLYITELQGTHAGCDSISGDFSLQASGFVIKNGELAEPVALITVAGNFLGLMKDVVEVANDTKLTYVGVMSPSVRVRPQKVSGL